MERQWSSPRRWSDQGRSGSGRGGNWNGHRRGRGGYRGQVSSFNRSERSDLCVDSEYDSCRDGKKHLPLDKSKVERNLVSWKDYEGGVWDLASTKAEPLKFEPANSSVHLRAMEFMQELKNERKMFETIRGGMMDCRGTHGIGVMCQFCDGKRGHWASANREGNHCDSSFRRYQDSVVNSLLPRQKKITTSVEEDKGQDEDKEIAEENLFRKKDLGEDAVQDEDYGVSLISLSTVNFPIPPEILN